MQRFTIVVEYLAIQDIQDIIDYYNKQQHGLGKRYYASINDAFDVLTINPFFKIYKKNIRSKTLKPFPFSIFFAVNEDTRTVNIYAVLHQAINPEKINKRFE